MSYEADSSVDAYPRVIRFPLETPRLLIRPMTLDDATDLHEVYSDAETMQLLTAELPRTLDETREWMVPKIEQQRRDGISLWSAVLRSSGKVVGDCGLQWADDEHSVMELGFRLNRAFWSRGPRSGGSVGMHCCCHRAAWPRPARVGHRRRQRPSPPSVGASWYALPT